MASYNKEQFTQFVGAAAGMMGMTTQQFSDNLKSLLAKNVTEKPAKELSGATGTKRTFIRPKTSPKELDLGTIMVDELGRRHMVVEQRAFNGSTRRWKMIKQETTRTDRPPTGDELRAAARKERQAIREAEESTTKTQEKHEDKQVSKRQYTVNRPTEDPSTLPVGYRAHDGIGRVHEIVEQGAFKGKANRWRLVKDAKVTFTEVDCHTGKPVQHTEDKTATEAKEPKRKYTKNVPDHDPRELEIGTIMFDDIGRAHEVVQQSAFNGVALRWHLIREAPKKEVTVKMEPGIEEPVEVATEGASKSVPVKKERKAPATSAKDAIVGDVVMGQDGITLFRCTERTRKSKTGGEATTYKVWQKMASA